MNLGLCPITLREANLFVEQHHRHSSPVRGHIVSVAAERDDEIVGVAIVGRPVARGLQDGYTAEVLRLATDGTQNACSLLYGACWRAAKALGYRCLVTYTLAAEGGASLQAAGWRVVAELPNRGSKGWNTPSRPRVEMPGQGRFRWEAGA